MLQLTNDFFLCDNTIINELYSNEYRIIIVFKRRLD